MAEESAKLRIPYIAAAQAQKHVTHNEAMTLLDTLVQLSVLDKDLTAPPGSPAEGDCYIVAGGGGTATDAWEGWEKRVARFIDGTWRAYLPGEGAGAGWLAWVLDEDAMYRFDGTDWQLAGIVGPPGPSLAPDAVVNALAGRDDYDDEAASFAVLVVADASNDGLPTLYYKLSAASADWSDPVPWPESPDVAPPRGHLWGLTLSNNASDATNDIDIATGEAADNTGAVRMVLASALTKRLDASWAVGTNQGGLDTGSIANTTYHVWLIQRSDTGVVDALFSTSATSPTMPANYDRKRRIGSIIRTSGTIVAFIQNGDYFLRATQALDFSETADRSIAVSVTLSIPIGINVLAVVVGRFGYGAGVGAMLLSSLAATNETPATSGPFTVRNAAAGNDAPIAAQIWTNTSAQIRLRTSIAASTVQVVFTVGWIDTRGRTN